MLHLPVLRRGRPYRSVDIATVVLPPGVPRPMIEATLYAAAPNYQSVTFRDQPVLPFRTLS